MNVRWDGLLFMEAAIPIADSSIFRWEFSLQDWVAKQDAKDGFHNLEVAFMGKTNFQSFKVRIDTEPPSVEAAIEAPGGNKNGRILQGIATSEQQYHQERLKVDVFFNYGGRPFVVPLPVNRIEDEEGRFYFQFRANIEGIPEISIEDPRYEQPFFALQVSDPAGNNYHYTMSYAQFMAPGTQRFGVSHIAKVQVNTYSELVPDQEHMVVDFFPEDIYPSKSEFNGTQAIHLEVEAHGTDFSTLTWVSELDRLYGKPVPTLIFRDEDNIAIVVDGNTYKDQNFPYDTGASYHVTQADEDGQTYISNVEILPPQNEPIEPIPTVSPTLTPSSSMIASTTPSPTPEDTENGMEVMERPINDHYPNPYDLITSTDIIFQQGAAWFVICNQAHTPIFDAPMPPQNIITEANFLESFKVRERNGRYVNVVSDNRGGVVGWIDMQNLILTQSAIKDSFLNVYYKIFLRRSSSLIGVGTSDFDRLREGPGIGIETSAIRKQEGEFYFLRSEDKMKQSDNVFLYLYGVYFDNETIEYQNTADFKMADYFLIGTSPSISTGDIGGESILGWLPREAVLVLNTRQALEKLSDRPKENWDAHIFSTRVQLRKYFSLERYEDKQRFLDENADTIVRDFGEGPPQKGQILRNFVVPGTRDEFRGVISYLTEYSRAGVWQEGFVALEKDGQPITRSILLLGTYELLRVKQAINNISRHSAP